MDPLALEPWVMGQTDASSSAAGAAERAPNTLTGRFCRSCVLPGIQGVGMGHFWPQPRRPEAQTAPLMLRACSEASHTPRACQSSSDPCQRGFLFTTDCRARMECLSSVVSGPAVPCVSWQAEPGQSCALASGSTARNTSAAGRDARAGRGGGAAPHWAVTGMKSETLQCHAG